MLSTDRCGLIALGETNGRLRRGLAALVVDRLAAARSAHRDGLEHLTELQFAPLRSRPEPSHPGVTWRVVGSLLSGSWLESLQLGDQFGTPPRSSESHRFQHL